jgi:hypothetical protein
MDSRRATGDGATPLRRVVGEWCSAGVDRGPQYRRVRRVRIVASRDQQGHLTGADLEVETVAAGQGANDWASLAAAEGARGEAATSRGRFMPMA